MNDPLKRRLTGALILLLLAIGLAFLLPDPDHPRVDAELRQVTIDLRNPGRRAAPAGEQLTPPSIAAPLPAAPPQAGDAVAGAVEPLVEIDEPVLARSPAVASPLSIRPSESLGQESQHRGVAPSPPQSTPPVQLRHSEVLHDLQKPPPEPPEPALTAQSRPVPAPQPKPAPTPVTPRPLPPVVVAARPATPAVPTPEPAPVKPAALAASPSAPVGDTRWTVQVGSYSEIANARNAESRLKAAGLPTLMSPVDTPKGTLYRVRIGPFGGEAQAQAARAKATQLGFAQATIRKD